MKIKTGITFILAILISNSAFCQDTSANQKLSENETYHIAPSKNKQIKRPKHRKHHIYRDTRLGSSSPLHDTYQTNDYGAGAVTTNPKKGSGSTSTPNSAIDSSKKNRIYRDTRLGSSSPLYDTYKKNDSGAGAVTTSPKKK